MPELSRYFRMPHLRDAFDAYGEFHRRAGWPLESKLDMYLRAERAFSNPVDSSSFEYVYQQLNRYWQVFRGADSAVWSSSQTFDFLTRPACARIRSLTLNAEWDADTIDVVLDHLNQMREIKPLKSSYPWMAVSKFMHFFNPHSFPIYDTAVVYEKVFKAFRRDYDAFVAQLRRRRGIVYSKHDGTFNLIYPLWAGELLRSSEDGFMKHFADWFQDSLQPSRRNDVPLTLIEYRATAFEFVAIGAAIKEGY